MLLQTWRAPVTGQGLPATVTELEELPGVGPAIAARIVDYRQKNNGFKKLEDVMNVRGIGEKLFLKLKPMITITAKSPDR